MIITIGGGLGCGAKDIAMKLAEELGYTFVNDDLAKKAMEDSGYDISASTAEYFDDVTGSGSISDMKGLSALSGNFGPIASTLSYETIPLDQKLAMAQRKVANDFADKDNCVLLGRCADYYLRDRKNVFKVFVINEEENCVARIKKDFSIDETAARKMVKKADKRRRDYYAFFTGEKWGDPENHDIVISAASLGIDGCVKIIKAAADL